MQMVAAKGVFLTGFTVRYSVVMLSHPAAVFVVSR